MEMFASDPECFRCKSLAVVGSKEDKRNRRTIHYCRGHMPPEVKAFQERAFAVMLWGRRQGLKRDWAKVA